MSRFAHKRDQSDKDEKKGGEKKRFLSFFTTPFFGAVIAAVVMAWFVSANLVQIMLISGDSMLPAYHSGQFSLILKTDRDFTAGDPVAIYSDGVKAVLVKRIAACPGERVVIRDGTLLIDGEPSRQYEGAFFEEPGFLAREISLKEGEYVVIGDNIAQSRDSRDERIGVVRETDIRGKVWPYRPLCPPDGGGFTERD